MVVTKKDIYDLIHDVVVPFEKHILDDAVLAKYIEDDAIKIKHDIGVAKLAIKMIKDPQNAQEDFEKGAAAHNNLDIPKETMQTYLSIFFKLHKEWTYNHFQLDIKEYEKNVQQWDRFFIQAYKGAQTQDESEDSFLLFENEEVDAMIEQMHYEDEKKISAIEYASHDEIHEEEFQTLLEVQELCEELSNTYSSFSEEFFQECLKIAQMLAKVLFITLEFKDIGYTINNFITTFQDLSPESMDEAQKAIAFDILMQINNDVIKWIDTVFVTKDAVDIHYFDASFLANIAQFNIMLEHQSSQDSQEDDDFLF